MPLLKMMSTKDFFKEKGLHVCHKSIKISKNPPSQARACQHVENISSCTPCSQDDECGRASIHNEGLSDLGGDEIIHDELSNEENRFQKNPSSLYSFTVDRMETTLATSTSNDESIFSPLSEALDFYSIEGSVNLYVPQLYCEDSDDQSRSSGGYKLCSASNFYTPESKFSGPSNGSSSEFGNITNTELLPDYKYEDSSLFCDLVEECLGLPYLEDALDAESNRGDRPSEVTIIDADYSSLHMAIHQVRYHNQSDKVYSYPDLNHEFFDPQSYIRSFPEQQDISSTLSPVLLPKEKRNNKNIMLVLDLDETLVHSTLDHCDDADFTFPVFFNMKEHTVYVKKRPYLQTFLNKVAEMFEIVVFTASQSIYAGQLLDILDPDQKVISKRAYRESCIFSDEVT